MNNMKWIIASFSPTGGTKKIADGIAAGFDAPLFEVDLMKPDCAAVNDADALMAVMPVYAGRVPQIAVERLKNLKTGCKMAVTVAVYGNREYDDALVEMQDALEDMGMEVIACAAFIAEHSIVHSIAANRPDAEDLAIARKFGADVMAKLGADQAHEPISVPGNRPYVELKPSAFHPQANDCCIGCGACAEQCPAAAIPQDAPNTTLNDLCINCMHCVQVCPQNARALPEAFLAGATKMLNEKAAGHKMPVIFM